MKPQSAPPRKKIKSWLKRLRRLALVTLILLLVVAWFAPTIIARTSLLNSLTRRFCADLQGQLTIGGASCSWFSPVELRDVRIRDEQGQSVLTVSRITSSKTLWSLIWDQTDLGRFEIDKPQINLAFQGKTSNLEKVFAKYLEPGKESSASPGLEFECKDAQVAVVDSDAGKSWTLDRIQIIAKLASQGDQPIQVEVKGQHATGNLDVKTTVSEQKGTASLKLENLPLALSQSLLRRFEPSLHLDGSCTANLQARWETDRSGTKGSLSGKLSAGNLKVRSDWLKQDELQLQSLVLPCNVRIEDNVVHVQQAKLNCDLGTAEIMGKIHLAQSLTANLSRPGHYLHLDVNLAKLANSLPHLLFMQDNITVTQGRVRATVQSSESDKGIVWKGNLAGTNLAAVRQGKTVKWNEPIALDFVAYQQTTGLPLIERLNCQSSFLNVQASQARDKISVTAQYDLDRLTQELGQFIDLNALSLSGRGASQLTLHQKDAQTFHLQGTTTLDKLAIRLTPTQTYREDSALLDVSALVKQDASRGLQIQRANARAKIAGDHLEVSLAEPGSKLQMQINGDLQRWQQRLRPLSASLSRFQLLGTGTITAEVRLQHDRLEASISKASVKGFQFNGYGLSIREPLADVVSELTVDLQTGAITFHKTKLTTPQASLTSQALAILTSDTEPLQMTGDLDVSGPVNNFKGWFAVAEPAMGGTLVGKLRFVPEQKQTKIDVDATLKDLVVGSSWSEPVVTFKGQATYDEKRDSIQAGQLVATSRLLNVSVGGRLTDLTGKQNLNAGGHVAYNLKRIEPYLRAFLVNDLQIEGQGNRPFRLAGSLDDEQFLTRAQGELGLHWQSLQSYGCLCGPVELKANLDKGWLRMKPTEFTLNKGIVRVTPSLRLAPESMELVVAPGQIIQKAELTPAMERGMKYALPVMSGLTQADGTISVLVVECQVPLDDPNRANVKGEIHVHSAEIVGSSIVRELSALVGSNPLKVQLAKESKVQFHLKDGWMLHDNLEIDFPGIRVRSRGAVRLDGVLSMEVEMPTPPSWARGRTLSRALAERKIRIPIRGTLSKPQLDRKALQSEFQRFVRDAGADTLKDKAREELRKLIPDRFRNK